MPLVNYGCIDLHHMSLLSSGRKLGTVNSSQSQLGRYSRLQSQQKQSKNKKTRTQLPAQKISWPDIRWPGHNSLEKKHPNFPISWINISFYFFIIINEYLKNHKSNQSKRFQVMRLPMNSIYFFFINYIVKLTWCVVRVVRQRSGCRAACTRDSQNADGATRCNQWYATFGNTNAYIMTR